MLLSLNSELKSSSQSLNVDKVIIEIDSLRDETEHVLPLSIKLCDDFFYCNIS